MSYANALLDGLHVTSRSHYMQGPSETDIAYGRGVIVGIASALAWHGSTPLTTIATISSVLPVDFMHECWPKGWETKWLPEEK